MSPVSSGLLQSTNQPGKATEKGADPRRGGARWYAAQTLPRSEERVEHNLARQGFQTLCPRFMKSRRHARRTEQVLTPLFPGYVFVRFDRQRHQWRSINGTYGVRNLVGPSVAPQAVPHGIVEDLEARCENGVLTSLVTEYAPGETVRILTGPLADRLATIVSLDEKGRIAVLFEMLSNTFTVKLASSQVCPA